MDGQPKQREAQRGIQRLVDGIQRIELGARRQQGPQPSGLGVSFLQQRPAGLDILTQPLDTRPTLIEPGL